MKQRLRNIRAVSKGPNFTAYLCLFAVCILWGTTWVVSSWTVRQEVSALQVAAIRQIIAGTIMCIGLFWFHKGSIQWPPLKDTLLLSLLNFIFSNGLSTWGVKYIPGGLASIVGAAYPLWLVVIYSLFFKKQISSLIWTGMVMAFIGLVLVFYPSLDGADIKGNFVFGFGLSVFSTITWALGTIYTKKQTTKSIDPYFSIGLQMLISGFTLSIVLLFNGNFTPIQNISLNVWLGISYLTLFGSLIAFSCFLYALKNLPAEQVSIYAYINPIVALLISHLFMGEKLSFLLLTGTAVVITGVFILNRAFKIA